MRFWYGLEPWTQIRRICWMYQNAHESQRVSFAYKFRKFDWFQLEYVSVQLQNSMKSSIGHFSSKLANQCSCIRCWPFLWHQWNWVQRRNLCPNCVIWLQWLLKWLYFATFATKSHLRFEIFSNTFSFDEFALISFKLFSRKNCRGKLIRVILLTVIIASVEF